MTTIPKLLSNVAVGTNNSIAGAIYSVTNLPSAIGQTLCHDQTSAIDHYIENLLILVNTEKSFTRGSPEQKNSLLWICEQIKSIRENSKELFRIDLTKNPEKDDPFKQLNIRLRRELILLDRATEHFKQNPNDTSFSSASKDPRTQTISITLDLSTHQAADAAIGALKTLKLSSTGLLTSKKHFGNSSSELTTFTENLEHLQTAIISKNPDDIYQRFLALDLNTILKHKNTVFYGKPFTVEDESFFKNFEAVFQDFQNLPEALKSDLRFRPNLSELMDSIIDMSEKIKPYITIQKGSGTVIVDHLTNIAVTWKNSLIAKGKEVVSEITPNILKNPTPS
ncbi:MAG: hypothetical protein WCG10_00600, partial [Chlamydiota bacterium]